MALLEIERLNLSFTEERKGMQTRRLEVIRSLDLKADAGEVTAVVGASGSGKSLLAQAIMGLLPANADIQGKILYDGSELTQRRIKKLRGHEIVLVPQSVASLDPLMKAGEQVRKGKKDRALKKRVEEIFRGYHLKEGVEELYPFELSGGMSRRVLMATALVEDPRLVIADEPTPGLDKRLARMVMSHLREMAERGAAVLVITHDLELAVSEADRIIVFYAGDTMEEAVSGDFLKEETLRHPYTKALFRAMPRHGFQKTDGRQPFAGELSEGCLFAPRCAECTEECMHTGAEGIRFREVRGGRVRCIHAK